MAKKEKAKSEWLKGKRKKDNFLRKKV